MSLALEPESAAIYCKEQALSRVGGVDGVYLRAFDPGERYIVVDCGGTLGPCTYVLCTVTCKPVITLLSL